MVDYRTHELTYPSTDPLSRITPLHYLVWLITKNDIKSFVLPETAFGIFSALAAPLTTNPSLTMLNVLSRLPQVILWN